jgi:hypothetical protein
MAKLPYSDEYLAFYDEYPRHEGKQDGQKAWNALTDDDRLAAMADVRKRKRAGAYPTNKKLIQLPASYLRAGRWEDDWQDTVDSSRKPDDGMVSRGTVDYQPLADDFKGSRWEMLANRILLKYLRTARGLQEWELQKAVAEKVATSRELGPAFDEDIAGGMPQIEAVTEFVTILVARVDKAIGRTLKHKLIRL